MVDRNVQIVVDTLTVRIKDVQQSILEFLKKLEMQDRLEWPDMLDSFAVLSSQFESLLSILRNERTPSLRNVVFLPIRLSLDFDPPLQLLTDGRLTVWNHAVAPDYLRTKPDLHMEEIDKEFLAQYSSRGADYIQKQIASMNKCIDNIISNIQSASSTADSADVDNLRPSTTYNTEDTKKLIAAITTGKDIKPPQAHGGGGKYTSSAKAAAKQAATTAQPYAR